MQADASTAQTQHKQERGRLQSQCTLLTAARDELQALYTKEQARGNDIHAALARRTAEMSAALRSAKEQSEQALADAKAAAQAQLLHAKDAHDAQMAALRVRHCKMRCHALLAGNMRTRCCLLGKNAYTSL